MKWTYLAVSTVVGLAAISAQPQGKSDQGQGGKAGPPSKGSGGPAAGSGKGSPPQGGGGGPIKSSPPPQSGGSSGKGGPPSLPPRSDSGSGKSSPPSSGSPRIIFPPQNGSPRKDPPRSDSGSRRDQGGRSGDVFDKYRNRDGGVGNGNGGQNGDIIWRRDPRNGSISIGKPDDGKSNNRNDGRGGRAIKIDRAPIDARGDRFDVRVRQDDRYTVHPKWRDGYYHYDRGWDDDCWRYGYYRSRPWDDCVMSPWYYYGHLPAYLLCARVIFIDCDGWSFRGDRYRWQRPDRYGYGRYGELDYAIEDLVNAFEVSDRRSLARIMPRGGRVNIAVDGRYAYSVGADDFYDMLWDLSQTTRTRQYRILEVRRYGDEAQIAAEHVYTDPWGGSETMFHTYRLERERGGYVIRDFGSSAYRYGGF